MQRLPPGPTRRRLRLSRPRRLPGRRHRPPSVRRVRRVRQRAVQLPPPSFRLLPPLRLLLLPPHFRRRQPPPPRRRPPPLRRRPAPRRRRPNPPAPRLCRGPGASTRARPAAAGRAGRGPGLRRQRWGRPAPYPPVASVVATSMTTGAAPPLQRVLPRGEREGRARPVRRASAHSACGRPRAHWRPGPTRRGADTRGKGPP